MIILEKVDRHVHKLAVGADQPGNGAVIGISSKIAEFLRWGDRERLALIVGLSALLVGPALLLDREP